MGSPVLTIAVPTYNMERWLEKNLATYMDPALKGRLEVLCLNNASTDASKDIIKRYVSICPDIFVLVDRTSRGYGGSINEAIALAGGEYFRIVDADDWVDTGELIRFVDTLERCDADVILTDYQIVDLSTGKMTPVRAEEHGIEYSRVYQDLSAPTKTLPSIHNTTYRTALLRECGLNLQDELFFVDEEYVILPYLAAKTVIYYPFDVYRYQVANPAQSTSPENRAKYQHHREKILKRLLAEYAQAEKENPNDPALSYCFERIRRGVGDHFTTLYIYVEPRKAGRELAARWKEYLKTEAPAFWKQTRGKAEKLSLLNLFRVSLPMYERLKRMR